MSTEPDILLPETDPDLALARRIGFFLEAPAQLSAASGDPLESMLHAWNRARAAETAVLHVDSEALWSRISAAIPESTPAINNTSKPLPNDDSATIAPAAKTPASFLRLDWRIWSAAATVLFAAILGYSLYLVPEHFGPFAETQILTLSDGSSVTLRKNSVLSVLENPLSGNTNLTLAGEARFEVTKNQGRKFSVTAGEATVVVTGTAFQVQQTTSGIRVFLEEGRVNLVTPDGAATPLQPGDVALVKQNQPPTVAKVEQPEEISDWLNNRLTFVNQPLRFVLPDLELHFNLRFDLDDVLLDERLTGELQLESEVQVLGDLGQALGGRFELHGTMYRFIAD